MKIAAEMEQSSGEVEGEGNPTLMGFAPRATHASHFARPRRVIFIIQNGKKSS
jgi:hypothetical protein